VTAARGRVLAAPAIARLSSPNFHAAAMDGMAVDAKDTFGASDESPKTLVPGKPVSGSIPGMPCRRIPMP
jgi:molybdopterin biosynthesis enzyme